jgi:hypothetical protein
VRRAPRQRRVALLVVVACLAPTPFVAAAAAAPGDRFSAQLAPAAVQPQSSGGYQLAITNRNNSTNPATIAHVSVPSGFLLDAATLFAQTSASGSCSAATWSATLNAAGSTVDVVAPTGPQSQLCPGGTLRITFNATAPAAEGNYPWATTLSGESGGFDLQGPQASVSVDATAPAAPTVTAPSNRSNSRDATFTFTDVDPAATFLCQLDQVGDFSPARAQPPTPGSRRDRTRLQ